MISKILFEICRHGLPIKTNLPIDHLPDELCIKSDLCISSLEIETKHDFLFIPYDSDTFPNSEWQLYLDEIKENNYSQDFIDTAISIQLAKNHNYLFPRIMHFNNSELMQLIESIANYLHNSEIDHDVILKFKFLEAMEKYHKKFLYIHFLLNNKDIMSVIIKIIIINDKWLQFFE